MKLDASDIAHVATAAAFDQLDRPKPLQDTKGPPGNRYCDLVLTGGVADGVVYPWAITEIARAYRFKNIAGTSVGAIAAALTAAAELSRRQGHLNGFNDVLQKLPERLAEPVGGKTRLYSLFQPEKSTRRLFGLFVGLFSPKSLDVSGPIGETLRWLANAAGVKGRVLLSVLQAYWPSVLLGVLLGVALALGAVAHWGSYFGGPGFDLVSCASLAQVAGLAVPMILICALALVGYAAWCDGVDLIENNYGLCTGGHAAGVPDDEKSLVEWIHKGIQGAARRTVDEPPLTFKDLWDAPLPPVEGPREPALPTRKPRSIDLRMITTCLTQGRPYQLPLEDDTERMFFNVKELRPYFPRRVLDHLVEVSSIYIPGPADPQPDPGGVELRELPRGDLPLVVAARMSLSFPILFSTVPLWTVDHVPVWDNAAQTLVTRKAIRRCQFSDGGICSNFPIHLFDAAIPDWPTFGISLAPNRDGDENRVWLPKFHYEGRGESRFGFDDLGKSPWQRLGGLLSAIGRSAKDWSDNTTMRMPGVRDRVARVLMGEAQGGLDLRISSKKIEKLAELGTKAGRALVGKFTDPNTAFGPSRRWHEHRWVRFNTFLAALRERTEGLFRAAEEANHCMRLSDQISEATRQSPLEGASPDDPASQGALTAEQARELLGLLGGLEALEKNLAENSSVQPYDPKPRPELHVRPPV